METDTKEKNFADLLKFDYIYMMISGWMAVCMLCLCQPFMQLWMGEELMFPFSVMILFPIYFYLLKMGDMRSVYSNAAGLFWENRRRTIAEAIANIVLNYIFVIKWGAFGIIIATTLTLFVFGFCCAARIFFKCYFEAGIWKYFGRHAIYAVVTIVNAIITYSVCLQCGEHGIMALIMRGIVCCTVSPLLYFAVFFRTEVFKDAVGWVKKVILSR